AGGAALAAFAHAQARRLVHHADLAPLAVLVLGAGVARAGADRTGTAARLGVGVAGAGLQTLVALAEADLAVPAVAVGAAAGYAGGGAQIADFAERALHVERAATASADARGDVAELAAVAVVVPLADAIRMAVAVAAGQGLPVLLLAARLVAEAGAAGAVGVAGPVGWRVEFGALLGGGAARAALGLVVAGQPGEARGRGCGD